MSDDWQELADGLIENGVPERRATVVAQVAATDRTYAEIADDVGLAGRGKVGNYVADYRDQLDDAQWLAEHGPEI